MDKYPLATQMMEWSKKAFDEGFRSMAILQSETEKLAWNFLDKTPFFPQEGRKLFSDWAAGYKKGLEYFKSTTDSSYEKVKQYFEEPPKPQATKTKRTKRTKST